MFKNLFSSKTNPIKKVHCEITGKAASLLDTVVLTRINGIIALNNLEDPEVDEIEKVIYSSFKPPIDYFVEIPQPTEIVKKFGRFFAIVDDSEEPEQSTAVITEEGRLIHTFHELSKFMSHIEKGFEVVRAPETMFVAIIDNDSPTKIKTCSDWGNDFNSIGKKYRAKTILEERRERQTYGNPGILWPGYDVGIGDCSVKNQNGTGYLFKTDKVFKSIDFCSNESAVDFCKKNKSLVYYNDFLNKGALRVLSPYTEDINIKLKNPYLFRSSNI